MNIQNPATFTHVNTQVHTLRVHYLQQNKTQNQKELGNCIRLRMYWVYNR